MFVKVYESELHLRPLDHSHNYIYLQQYNQTFIIPMVYKNRELLKCTPLALPFSYRKYAELEFQEVFSELKSMLSRGAPPY